MKLFKIFISVIFILFISYTVKSEGTKEVMPTANNGTAILVKPNYGFGNYRDCPTENRIYFRIKNNSTENFYFGLNKYMRIPTVGIPSNVYYRIVNPSGNQVVAPTLVPGSGNGYISSYSQAVAGPKIGVYNPTGYSPITYDPTVNGEFYIELYRSNDNGNTVDNSVNGEVFFIYFDFTVATTSNVKYKGRVHSKAWSIITYNPEDTYYNPDINFSFEGDYYGYTADSSVNRV